MNLFCMILTLALGGIAGILAGTAVCERLSGRSLQQGFAGFVLLMMAVVLVQNFVQLFHPLTEMTVITIINLTLNPIGNSSIFC